MRARNVLVGLLSGAAALAIVWGIYVYQLGRLEDGLTVNVPVPASFIPAGTLIEAGMLEWIPLERSALLKETVTAPEQIIGMENVVPLGKHEPVLAWKLDRHRLLPAQGQATFRIPREYVLSIAGGIRAGDAVKLYASEAGRSRRLFDHDVIVASVRTASGEEVGIGASSLEAVAGDDKARLYASRRMAGGVIDAVDLNLTEEEWLTIDRLCKTGEMKLVIALSPDVLQRGGDDG